MVTNNDVTIYHRVHGADSDTWVRSYVPDVWLFNAVKATVTTEGQKIQTNITNAYTMRVPDLSVVVAVGDYVVVGNCPVSMETVRDLEGYEHFIVNYANYNRHGHNKHIKVVGA